MDVNVWLRSSWYPDSKTAYLWLRIRHSFLFTYLKERKQKVLNNGISSLFEIIISGMLQGSAVNTILFNIFLKSFPPTSRCQAWWSLNFAGELLVAAFTFCLHNYLLSSYHLFSLGGNELMIYFYGWKTRIYIILQFIIPLL